MDIRKIEEIEKIQKEHLDEEFKQRLQDMTNEYEEKAMFYKYFGYIPRKENPNKKKQETKAKKAKKRRIKRQSKRRNKK